MTVEFDPHSMLTAQVKFRKKDRTGRHGFQFLSIVINVLFETILEYCPSGDFPRVPALVVQDGIRRLAKGTVMACRKSTRW